MVYEDSIQSIQRDGFDWKLFRDYFPFGDIRLRESNYHSLVSVALEALSQQKQRNLLIALLDTQAAAFLEQVFVQNEIKGKPNPDGKGCGLEAHFALAWIQINSNLCAKYGLRKRNLRSVMLELGKEEYLADKICG